MLLVDNNFMGRYERNILIKEIGEIGQRRLRNSRVLVCGAGGLGSGVIVNLICLGVGHIGIVDDDKVEFSNLNRQYIHKMTTLGQDKVLSAKMRINEFNPEVDVMPYKLRLDKDNARDIFVSYDLIIDCFDNYYSKFILSDTAVKTGKTLIHGGVEEFCGQVCVIKKDTACLACFIPELYNCSKDIKIKTGTISPVVSTIASIQSMEALKIITGTGEPLYNTMLFYNGLSEQFRKIKIEKNKNCPSCAK